MQVNVSVKNIRISPRKLRLVVDQVRGQKALDAQRTLQFLVKKGSEPVLKLLNSAIANAKHNYKLDAETLVVKTIQVDEGFTIKRFRPRAFGRAAMIRKRTSHIRLTLEDSAPKAEKPKAAKTDTAAPTAAKAEEKKPAVKKEAAKKPAAKKAAPKEQ